MLASTVSTAAVLITASLIVLFHATTFCEALISAFVARKSTPMVVVFKPPPVDPGEAPIAINTIMINVADKGNAAGELVENPAVLQVIDQNQESEPAPEKSNRIVPPISRYTLALRISLVCTVIR